MTTCSVTFVHGVFKKVSGESPIILSDHKAQVDGWICVITPSKITCTFEYFTETGKHRLIYTILRNGFSKKVLKGPGQSEKTLKKYWVCKPNHFNFSGTIFFSENKCGTPNITYKESVSSG